MSASCGALATRVLLVAAGAAALAPTPFARCSSHSTAAVCSAQRSNVVMKDWSRRATLAEKEGGAGDIGLEAVGIEGDIAVEFLQGNRTLRTMATVGQPLSSVAAQAGQFIKYKCKKGECGTCAVRVNGEWIRTCSVTVPYMPKGTPYEIFVRGTMLEPKRASRFFSVRSFYDGFRNNLLGMVGFVKEGPLSRKGKKVFNDRIGAERLLQEKVAARKAAKKAAAEAGLTVEEYLAREQQQVV